ncbi:putative transcriptional regulatory protein [Fusarium culmorum]|uniref:Putative transcriptional regulatory protein n=1 Tax=Fusarium culmorum TaxID=5516 RepID=A0A2T4GGQ8_FUSCU|nr:putative transcriptional regulatory protein [Fusarium culmorum]
MPCFQQQGSKNSLVNVADTERCTRTSPCGNCATAGVSCEYEKTDKRRNPPSSEYTDGLRNRVASLEAFIQDLKDASPTRRDEMLGTVANIGGAPFTPTPTAGPSHVTQSETPTIARLKPDAQGSLIYHGATSIFNSDLLSTSETDTNPVHAESNFDHVIEHFGIKLEDDTVFKALQQFFRWQYPHFMFVYRETFLRDHFGERKGCKYWSSALLLSICALGLLMSEDERERGLVEQFFRAAESIVMVSGLNRPSIPTVQCFLCLAFFEIGQGNVSKGWAYSGIAFRMAQDLGFQSDPMNWLPHDSTIVSSEDIEIRRRIYWGCYISDKLISLILGRPVQLAFDSSEVELLEFMIDGPGMEYWRPVGFDDGLNELRGQSNIPYLKEQIRLYRIVERMMTTVFSSRTPRTQTDISTRQTLLDNLNLELLQWKDTLPPFARWNKWSTSTNMTPAVATLHSIRIALNYESATTSNVESARKACTTASQDVLALVRIYKIQYGLRHAPLILIYACMQTARSIDKFGIPEEKSYLSGCLAECSHTWSIVGLVQGSAPVGNLEDYCNFE